MQNNSRFPQNIITKRPANMDYAVYRRALKIQKALIKSKLLPGKSLNFGIAAMMHSPSKKMEIRRNEILNSKRPKPTNVTPKKPNRN